VQGLEELQLRALLANSPRPLSLPTATSKYVLRDRAALQPFPPQAVTCLHRQVTANLQKLTGLLTADSVFLHSTQLFLRLVHWHMDKLEHQFPVLSHLLQASEHVSTDMVYPCLVASSLMSEVARVIQRHAKPDHSRKPRHIRLLQAASVLVNLDFSTPLALLSGEHHGLEVLAPAPSPAPSPAPVEHSPSTDALTFFVPEALTEEWVAEFLASQLLNSLVRSTLPLADVLQAPGAQDTFLQVATFATYAVVSVVADRMVDTAEAALLRILGLEEEEEEEEVCVGEGADEECRVQLVVARKEQQPRWQGGEGAPRFPHPSSVPVPVEVRRVE
jgi:hypothetical protein